MIPDVHQSMMGYSGHLHPVRKLISLQAFSTSTRTTTLDPPIKSSRRRRQQPVRRASNSETNTISESAKLMQREIASLMPDPQGSDNLLDSGDNYSAGADWGFDASGNPPDNRMQNVYDDLLTGSDFLGRSAQRSAEQNYMSEEEFQETIESLPPDQRLQEMQWRADTLARQEWEADQAQEKAFELHSDQLEASNRYEICMRLGDVMNEIEQHDYYNSDDQDVVPSWIRAHFILESELEQERSGFVPPNRLETKQEAKKPEKEESLLPGVDDSFLQVNSMDDLLKDVLGALPGEDIGTSWTPPTAQQPGDDGEDEDSDDEEGSNSESAADVAMKKVAAGRSMLDSVMDFGSESQENEEPGQLRGT